MDASLGYSAVFPGHAHFEAASGADAFHAAVFPLPGKCRQEFYFVFYLVENVQSALENHLTFSRSVCCIAQSSLSVGHCRSGGEDRLEYEELSFHVA